MITNKQAVKQGPEYSAIAQLYGSDVATRSQLPLMNHINEGLDILDNIGSSAVAMAAFCLHPLFQNDEVLQSVGSVHPDINNFNPIAILLALEYRRAANSYLCVPKTDGWSIEEAKCEIGLLLPDVKHMLIADKVQNRKDFMTHHYGTHPRSHQLLTYFNNWHEILGIEIDSSATFSTIVFTHNRTHK